MDAKLLNQPIEIEMRVAKTREEYNQMSQDEIIEYSRKYGEKVSSCHKSDKQHRYPCSWCRQIPDETRIYKSPDGRDARYLCYRCVTEEDQLKEWKELTETSYWLPIAPPPVPQFNTAEDPDLTVEVSNDIPAEIRNSILQTPLYPGRIDTRGPSSLEMNDLKNKKRKKE
jgi:hypothetical protein